MITYIKNKILPMLLCGVVLLCSGCISLQRKSTGYMASPSDEAPAESPIPSAPAEKGSDKGLSAPFDTILAEQFQNYNGKLAYSLHLFGRGQMASGDTVQMKSASVIKLFIMDYAYSLIEKGALTPETMVGGRPVSSLIEAMITVSDNTATNLLIDYFTMEKINEHIVASGYTGTVLARKMLDTAAANRGEENYTTARDVMTFLNKLYDNKNSYPQREMLAIMKRQQIATKLRRDMPAGVEMASKTGELSDTENDVALVFTPKGDYAIVCLTGGGAAQTAKNAMAIACRKIYDALQAES